MADPANELQNRFFASLHEAQQLLRLFDFLPNVFLYVKDIEGRFTAMNEQLVRLRGATNAEELLGKTDVELHPTYWGRLYQEEDRRVIESGAGDSRSGLAGSGGGWQIGHVRLKQKFHYAGKNGKVIGIAGVMYQLEGRHQDQAESDPIAEACAVIHAGVLKQPRNQPDRREGRTIGQPIEPTVSRGLPNVTIWLFAAGASA